MLTQPGKLSLAKVIAIFASAVFPKLPNQGPKDPLDWIILDIWVWRSFISVDKLLGKTFPILVVYLVVRKNSFGNSSTWKFFLSNINIVSVLFFAAHFNFFGCVFVTSTFAF